MKKIFKLLVATLIATATLALSSCEYFEDLLEDAFEGPSDTWLEMGVSHNSDSVTGDAYLAFFYTEQSKKGHTDNNTRLVKNYELPAGLTVLCYGMFSPISGSGATENAYFIKHISLEDGAKTKWSVIYNASSPLRKLEKKGEIDAGTEGTYSWIKGENYGTWHSVVEGEEIDAGMERVPLALTNQMNKFYLSNQSEKYKTASNWDNTLGKIGIKSSMFE